jgi:hypothetical protein
MMPISASANAYGPPPVPQAMAIRLPRDFAVKLYYLDDKGMTAKRATQPDGKAWRALEKTPATDADRYKAGRHRENYFVLRSLLRAYMARSAASSTCAESRCGRSATTPALAPTFSRAER